MNPLGVSFYHIAPEDLHHREGTCSICQDSIYLPEEQKQEGNDEPDIVVAHPPPSNSKILVCDTHLKCLKSWLSKHSDCPTCKYPVNAHSVFSVRERWGPVIIRLTPIALAALAITAKKIQAMRAM